MYNNGLITKLVSIFADVEEIREEREESLALIAMDGCMHMFKLDNCHFFKHDTISFGEEFIYTPYVVVC